MKVVFSEEEKWLIALLKNALENKGAEAIALVPETVDGKKVVTLAKKHAVLSFLYDITKDNELLSGQCNYIEKESRQIVLQSYRLLFLTKYVVEKLEEQGISVIVLKGVATGSLYPIPELRKSGDVDLLIPKMVDKKKIIQIMKLAGFHVSNEQHANHHIVFISSEGISIEVHTMLAEPFVYKNINRAMEEQMKECWGHLQKKDIMGVELPVLDNPFHAYELLLHMLQHFVYAGFGLKLLCDWVVIWNQNWSEQEKLLFTQLVTESGLKKFAETLTMVCNKYLGLKKELFAWKISDESIVEEVLREILDAEDFGNADVNRMVMMSGTGITAYIKEFHHQMHLNFPRAGKCFLLWPILWLITLVRFLRNNRKIRSTSAREILREAGRRSNLIKKLKIFEKN